MNAVLQTVAKKNVEAIHDAAMHILAHVGVKFNDEQAINTFKQHGFKTEGRIVRFDQDAVERALAQCPQRFQLTARNAEKNVWVGGSDWVLAPAYGAPFICHRSGELRRARMSDYDVLCKLVQTSSCIDITGYKMVEPDDVRAQNAYLDMMFAGITLSDKPFMGSTDSRQAAQDTIEMAACLFGGYSALERHAVVTGLISALSPLQYSEEMAGALMTYAKARQPVVIANMVMGGTSGPIRLAGLLALMNAELLAGVVLAQLVRPGTPVIYGSTSCPTRMQTGAAAVGSPEAAIIAHATCELARFYGLPSRSGGSLTDALVPDAQALAEGTLMLSTAISAGTHFILHACGMMGTYIGLNIEKWLIDEEMCAMLRHMQTPIDFSPEAFAIDEIMTAGIGGSYLMQPSTVAECRTAYYPFSLFNKQDHGRWSELGSRRIEDVASQKLAERLACYEKPDIAPDVESDLPALVRRQRNR